MLIQVAKIFEMVKSWLDTDVVWSLSDSGPPSFLLDVSVIYIHGRLSNLQILFEHGTIEKPAHGVTRDWGKVCST